MWATNHRLCFCHLDSRREPGGCSVGSFVMKKGLVFFFLVKAKTHWIMLAGTIKTQKN